MFDVVLRVPLPSRHPQFFETSAKANTNVDEVFQVGAGACASKASACVAGGGAAMWLSGRVRALLLKAALLPHCGQERVPPAPRLQSVARDIMLRLKDTQPDAASSGGGGGGPNLRVGAARPKAASSKSGCC